jgi:hypothetical protein
LVAVGFWNLCEGSWAFPENDTFLYEPGREIRGFVEEFTHKADVLHFEGMAHKIIAGTLNLYCDVAMRRRGRERNVSSCHFFFLVRFQVEFRFLERSRGLIHLLAIHF